MRCYCTSKTRKSESNSQLSSFTSRSWECCYCTSKTRKSESNSQLTNGDKFLPDVVIALVKLENLKAIHNRLTLLRMALGVVIALVKLENLKAIHNSVLDLAA